MWWQSPPCKIRRRVLSKQMVLSDPIHSNGYLSNVFAFGFMGFILFFIYRNPGVFWGEHRQNNVSLTFPVSNPLNKTSRFSGRRCTLTEAVRHRPASVTAWFPRAAGVGSSGVGAMDKRHSTFPDAPWKQADRSLKTISWNQSFIGEKKALSNTQPLGVSPAGFR